MSTIKPSKESVFEYYINSVLTVNNILKEGDYSVQPLSGEQKIKCSLEEDINTFLLEIGLNEQEGLAFISNLKNHNHTKLIPVLLESKSGTHFFWDKNNMQKINGYDGELLEEYPWLLIKINAKNVS